MEEPEKKNKTMITGAVIALVASLITGTFTIAAQHYFNNEEKRVQLYLDEKKDFVDACDEYMKQYRQWRELMIYAIRKDSISSKPIMEFENTLEFTQAYQKWRSDFDLAYGRIFLLSNNEFGFNTIKVSTVLHNSLNDFLLNKNLSLREKQDKFSVLENYYFAYWLQPAQEEIFKYNSGERVQKTLREFQQEQQQFQVDAQKNDSINQQMHKGLSQAFEYLEKQDAIKGNTSKRKMPSKAELDSLVNSFPPNNANH